MCVYVFNYLSSLQGGNLYQSVFTSELFFLHSGKCVFMSLTIWYFSSLLIQEGSVYQCVYILSLFSVSRNVSSVFMSLYREEMLRCVSVLNLLQWLLHVF